MLVIVLWAITLLSILMSGMLMTMRADTRFAQVQSAAASARALAEAGIFRTIAILLYVDRQEIWKAHALAREFSLGEGVVRVDIEDEAGKIDLNRANEQLFDDLLKSVGVDDENRPPLIGALLDWRDRDNNTHVNGAEKAEYLAQDLPYVPKNGNFEAVEELQQVLGVRQALYERLKPAVTVHSKRNQVNIAVAPKAVLNAVPQLSAEQIKGLLIAQTAPSTPAARPTVDANYTGNFQGSVFTIRAEGVVRGAKGRIKAVVSVTRNTRRPYVILEWDQRGYDA